MAQKCWLDDELSREGGRAKSSGLVNSCKEEIGGIRREEQRWAFYSHYSLCSAPFLSLSCTHLPFFTGLSNNEKASVTANSRHVRKAAI